MWFDAKDVPYETAQNLAMFPENTTEDVEKMLVHIGVKKDQWDQKFVLSGGKKHPFKTPTTVFVAMKSFVDLRGAVSKKMLKELSTHCSSDEEK